MRYVKKIALLLGIVITTLILSLHAYPALTGKQVMKIETGSMQPTINPGQYILVQTGKQPKMKQIATFTRNGTPVTHRVVGKTIDNKYVFKGDSNKQADTQKVDEKEIIGTVTNMYPKYTYDKTLNLGALIFAAILVFFGTSRNRKPKHKKICDKI